MLLVLLHDSICLDIPYSGREGPEFVWSPWHVCMWLKCRNMKCVSGGVYSLQWRHNGRDGVSNHQPYDCLLNSLFRRRSKKISKLCITGLCEGNSPVTGEFPAQWASNAENVSIWWHHHVSWLKRKSPRYGLNVLRPCLSFLTLSLWIAVLWYCR